jgi:hypothetical protein
VRPISPEYVVQRQQDGADQSGGHADRVEGQFAGPDLGHADQADDTQDETRPETAFDLAVLAEADPQGDEHRCGELEQQPDPDGEAADRHEVEHRDEK